MKHIYDILYPATSSFLKILRNICQRPNCFNSIFFFFFLSFVVHPSLLNPRNRIQSRFRCPSTLLFSHFISFSFAWFRLISLNIAYFQIHLSSFDLSVLFILFIQFAFISFSHSLICFFLYFLSFISFFFAFVFSFFFVFFAF